MTTLRIEHAITDYATWRTAFDAFAEARDRAGVLTHVIRRPVDDNRWVTLDLEFASADGARAFLDFLEQRVWAVPANSPALAGSPVTRLLEAASSG